MGNSGRSGRATVQRPDESPARPVAEERQPPIPLRSQTERPEFEPCGFLLAVRAADLRVVYASANVREFLDFPAGEMVGQRMPEFHSEELLATISGASLHSGAAQHLRIGLPGVRQRHFHVTVHAIESLVCLEWKAVNATPNPSEIDALTQLPNRRVLLERLERLQRDFQSTRSSLIFLDIDRFKIVNDTFGHVAGDDLLIQVAQRLHACGRGDHLVARMGGDEFVVLCEDTSIAEASLIATRIVDSFQDPFVLNAKPFRCATSVGLAPMGGGMVGSVEDILHSADSAMYAAKRLGGNRFVIFEKQPREELLRQIQLEQDLFLAVDRDEIRVYFQPQISMDANQLIGFEALLRWVHPVFGNISPAEFVPMAERSGQIQPIGLWVMRESLRLIAKWRKRYLRELFVAVNVSGIQLAASEFSGQVLDALQETGLPPEALHLEVTESLLIDSSAEVQLCAIHDLGVKIAIDDFGTGYSSLAYLQRLSVSELKLDSTFLSDVGKDERKTTLFKSIVSMAHTLQLTVTAEGVEDVEQLQCIRDCCCDAAQGYLFSKALSAERVEEMLFGEWARGTLAAGPRLTMAVSVPTAAPVVSVASNAGAR